VVAGRAGAWPSDVDDEDLARRYEAIEMTLVDEVFMVGLLGVSAWAAIRGRQFLTRRTMKESPSVSPDVIRIEIDAIDAFGSG
jgi:hypothetical protein